MGIFYELFDIAVALYLNELHTLTAVITEIIILMLYLKVIDEIHGCPIFKWATEAWLKDNYRYQDYSPNNDNRA